MGWCFRSATGSACALPAVGSAVLGRGHWTGVLDVSVSRAQVQATVCPERDGVRVTNVGRNDSAFARAGAQGEERLPPGASALLAEGDTLMLLPSRHHFALVRVPGDASPALPAAAAAAAAAEGSEGLQGAARQPCELPSVAAPAPAGVGHREAELQAPAAAAPAGVAVPAVAVAHSEVELQAPAAAAPAGVEMHSVGRDEAEAEPPVPAAGGGPGALAPASASPGRPEAEVPPAAAAAAAASTPPSTSPAGAAGVAEGGGAQGRRGMGSRSGSLDDMRGVTEWAAGLSAAAVSAGVEQLREMFPDHSDAALRSLLLEARGSVESAAASLLGDPAPAPPASPAAAAVAAVPASPRSAAVESLAALFPSVARAELESAYERSARDLDAAVALLLGDPAPPPAAAAAAPAAPEARGEGEAAGEAPAKRRRVVRERDIAGFAFRLDEERHAQSLVGKRLDDAVEQIRADVAAFGEEAAFAVYCFQTMLEREQELGADYFVFYHSYSLAELLYEVQAELARAVYDLPDDFAPLPRLLHRPFHGKPTLELLMEDFRHMSSQDHDPAFRALAISASCSLFATSTEAPPTSCFRSGYSCGDLSFRGLLTSTLEAVGVPQGEVAEALADELVDIGDRHRVVTWPYKRSDSGRRGAHAVMGAAAGPAGHMLQVFVHKDHVDSIAYESLPMGVPTGRGPLSELLAAGRIDGQARVFMHPAVFTDTTKSRLFHYCADMGLSCMDPAVAGSRGALVQDLRKALSLITGDYRALRRAFKAIEGMPGSQDP
eukprot:m51a1_g8903 hypothetical protein (777) ;mRNA; f:740566-743243